MNKTEELTALFAVNTIAELTAELAEAQAERDDNAELARLLDTIPTSIHLYKSVLDQHYVVYRWDRGDDKTIMADADTVLEALREAERRGWQ